jgi:hypothetical protein
MSEPLTILKWIVDTLESAGAANAGWRGAVSKARTKMLRGWMDTEFTSA